MYQTKNKHCKRKGQFFIYLVLNMWKNICAHKSLVEAITYSDLRNNTLNYGVGKNDIFLHTAYPDVAATWQKITNLRSFQ